MENKNKNTTLIKLSENVIPEEIIESKIIFLRGKKVILDSDLAMLYEVETKQLKRAVKRNLDRFPEDFMFELTREESEILRCQFGTLRWGEHSKYLPYAFSEHGILMLPSVLNSERAIQINIQIMRIFVNFVIPTTVKGGGIPSIIFERIDFGLSCQYFRSDSSLRYAPFGMTKSHDSQLSM